MTRTTPRMLSCNSAPARRCPRHEARLVQYQPVWRVRMHSVEVARTRWSASICGHLDARGSWRIASAGCHTRATGAVRIRGAGCRLFPRSFGMCSSRVLERSASSRSGGLRDESRSSIPTPSLLGPLHSRVVLRIAPSGRLRPCGSVTAGGKEALVFSGISHCTTKHEAGLFNDGSSVVYALSTNY